jgi:hypothetical protein
VSPASDPQVTHDELFDSLVLVEAIAGDLADGAPLGCTDGAPV